MLGFIKALKNNAFIFLLNFILYVFLAELVYFILYGEIAWRSHSAIQLFAEWFHVQYWRIHYLANFTSPCTNRRWKSAIPIFLILSFWPRFFTWNSVIQICINYSVSVNCGYVIKCTTIVHRVKTRTFIQNTTRKNIIRDKYKNIGPHTTLGSHTNG